jgi:hypothetical protein
MPFFMWLSHSKQCSDLARRPVIERFDVLHHALVELARGIVKPLTCPPFDCRTKCHQKAKASF